ncbi:MAG: hypothetical protein WC928_02235 [Patescibacteria group bacterium]|jgi:dephospho-CoA kinase
MEEMKIFEKKECLPANINPDNICKKWANRGNLTQLGLGVNFSKGEKGKRKVSNFIDIFVIEFLDKNNPDSPFYRVSIEADPVIQSIKEILKGRKVSLEELRNEIKKVISIYYECKHEEIIIKNEENLTDEELSLAIDCWNSDSCDSLLKEKNIEVVKKVSKLLGLKIF